jgi:HEAT repeat protein
MVLPVLLSICAGFAIAIGTLGLSAASFFVLVALSKMVWVVTRTSMFEPSFRVLYQPVEPVDRLAFQTHVEGTAKQLATGVVGVALLVFSRSEAFNALNLFYALVPILGIWLVANLMTYKDYRAKLMDSLTSRVRKEGVKKPIDVLRTHLHHQDPRQRETGLHLLEKIDPSSLAPAMTEMLCDPSFRKTALDYIAKNRFSELKDEVAKCSENGDPASRSLAEQALEQLHDSEVLAASPDRVEKMVRSPQPEERGRVADAIGQGSGVNAGQLSVLLFDQDWNVRQAALKAAGKLGNAEFWPQIISHLSSPVLSASAATALVQVGEPVLGDIEKTFNKEDLDPNARVRFLKIYEDIGGDAANSLLANKLTYPDATVRRQALIALSRCGYQADPEHVPEVERAIEQTVGDIVWNMSALLDLGEDESVTKLRAALEEEIEEHRSKLFLLLSLLYDPWSIGLVKENIESESQEATVYALEIMDILVSSEIKPLLFPVLEDLTYSQVLKRLEAWYPRQRLSREERLSAIINRDYAKIGTWTRACAIQSMSEATSEIRPDLVASLFHPNPLIFEVAARSILELNSEAYRLRRKKLPYESRERLDYVIGRNGVMEHWESRSVFGRVGLLRSMMAFSTLPSEALVRLASASEERILRPSRRLPSTKEPKDSVYIILDGAVSFADEGGQAVKSDLPRLSLIAFGPGARAVKTTQDSRFIRLDPDQLFELAGEYVELIPALVRAEQQIFDIDVHPQHTSVGPPIEPVELGSLGQSEV